MSAQIADLPLAPRHRTVQSALGDAQRVRDLKNVLVIGDTTDGFLMISSGDGQPLTCAESLWLLEMAKLLLMAPERKPFSMLADPA